MINRKQKKILLLIPALNAGGAERVMITLANEWVKENSVSILIFGDNTCFYEVDDKVNILSMNLILPQRGIKRILTIPQMELQRFRNIYKQIKCGNYDFILSFCWTTNMCACIIANILQHEKIIISERADPNRYGKWIKHLMDIFYRKPKAIICQSENVRQYFNNNGFKNQLIVLPNPVNFADIPSARPEEIQKEIVTVGRLVKQKNHKLLIDAFSHICMEYPDYSLKIFGDGPLKSQLEKQIYDLGLSNRVFLVGEKKRVMYEVNKAAFFVLTSDYEGFPNVLIEAMATGMPVISSRFNTGVADELIVDGENGYLFEVGNLEDLVSALRKMLTREEEYKCFEDKNRNVVLKFSPDIVANDWMKTIDSI